MVRDGVEIWVETSIIIDNALSKKLVIDGAQVISNVLMESVVSSLVTNHNLIDARLLARSTDNARGLADNRLNSSNSVCSIAKSDYSTLSSCSRSGRWGSRCTL